MAREMVGCFDRIEKQKKKRKKTKRGISFVFSFRRVNSTPPPTILTYRSPEGRERRREWSSARKSMRSHFNIRPKHRGEKVGNKAIPGKFWILVALRWHYWPATARCIIPSIINSTDIADYFVHRAIAIHLGFPSLCSLAASQFPPRYLLKKVPESYQSSPF